MSMTPKKPSLPVPSTVMVWQEFLEATGIAPERLQELVGLGWIEARTSAAQDFLFRDVDIYRVRKLERICCDFEHYYCGSSGTHRFSGTQGATPATF